METAHCTYEWSLVREAQGGHHAAFTQLVHAHDETVLRVALRITGSQSDAQDIYQEVFERFTRSWIAFDSTAHFPRGYLESPPIRVSIICEKLDMGEKITR
jgi:DNA-directed RNA polymerase specialized sigma24 family protein